MMQLFVVAMGKCKLLELKTPKPLRTLLVAGQCGRNLLGNFFGPDSDVLIEANSD